MWIVVQAFPQWKPELETAALHFVEAGFSWQSVCLAVLGGSTITLMTRMQHGTDSEMAKIVAFRGTGDLRRLVRLVRLHAVVQHPRRSAFGHGAALVAQQGFDS